MTNLALVSQPTEFLLEVTSGSEKGAVYRLMADQVTIGREPSCDIVVRGDPKCSRRHAQISVTGGQVRIADVSDQNRLWVDGTLTTEAVLKNGSRFRVGETDFCFRLSPPIAPPRDKAAVSNRPPSLAKMGRRRRRSSGSRPSLGYFLIGVGILAGLGFLFNKQVAKKPSNKVKSLEEFEQETQNLKTLQEKVEEQRKAQGHNSKNYQVAQRHWKQGLRDFENGQYERSIVQFNACLTSFPNHFLCRKYLLMAEASVDKIVQTFLVQGRQSLDQGQYAACVSAYQNVMYLRSSDNPEYQQAKAGLEYCLAKQREAQ